MSSHTSERVQLNQLKKANEQLVHAVHREADKKDIGLNQYAQVLAHVQDAVVATDTQMLVTGWNKAAEQMYGKEKGEVIGKCMLEAVGSDQWPILPGTLSAADPVCQDGEDIHHHKDGHVINVNRTVVALFQDNVIRGYLSINRDITKQKLDELKHEEWVHELTEANLRLVKLTQVKSEFLSTMSHELRTPLNGIIGFSDLLKDGEMGKLTPDQEMCLDNVLESGRHLLQIIDDVLEASRIEAGRVILNVETFDLFALIHQAMDALKPSIIEKGLNVVLHEERRVEIVTDRTKLLQIILNLVGNAVKFTDHGQIDVRCRLISGRIEIDVSDTGIGIAQDRLPLVFDSFFQVESKHSRQYGGTGLGLYLSKQLVELLGGTIEAKSTPGVGSTFTVTLSNCLEETPDLAIPPDAVAAPPIH